MFYMIENKDIEKDFEYLGLRFKSYSLTFRRKDLARSLERATKWMKEYYGSTFVGFEFREDLGNQFVSRMNDSFGNHLNDTCTISKIGSQWRVSLYCRK